MSDKVLNTKSDKILLVLDLDETLIHACYAEKNMQPSFELDEFFVYKRPFLTEFFDEIKDIFLLAIWSSASEEYVNQIVKKVVPNHIQLEFVWSRKRCTLRRDLNCQFQLDPDYYEYTKSLKKLTKKGYNIERILIVDDTPFKCFANYGNAIYPQEFEGCIQDDELLYLAKYLKSLQNVKNVRHIEKRGWRNNISL